MNLILVSGRYADPERHHSRDEALVRSLSVECSVRWIVPVPRVHGGSSDPARIEVESPVPPFSRVSGRLVDGHTERAVSQEIRRELPDLVHVLDFGGASSCNICWVADRLGVPSVVTASAVPTVCHRGDLRRAPEGVECTVYDDPDRCSKCVCASPELGLRRRLLAMVLRRAPLPFRAYPAKLDFESRFELVLAGLQSAGVVLVDSDEERARLEAVGLRPKALRVLPRADAESLLTVYRDVIRAT